MKRIWSAIPPLFRWLAAAFAAAGAVGFFFVALSRMGYPFELEFEEGDLFLGALRVLDGKSIYPSPDQDPFFVPILYTPFYYYLCAGAMALFGRALSVCRAVSFSATVLIAGLIVAVARRRGVGWRHAVASGFLFLAFFPGSGFWYDLARLDGVFLALCLGGFFLLDRGDFSPGRIAGAASLLVLAVFTKQVGVFYLAGAGLFLLWKDFRKGFLFCALSGLAILAIGLAFHLRTGGNFTFFTLAVGPAHEFYLSRFGNPLPWLSRVWPLALGLVVVAFLERGKSAGQADRRLWVLFLLASIPAALLPWAKAGNYLNDFIPLFLSLAILVALFEVDWILPFVLLQLGLLVYNPLAQVPAASMRNAGESFIASLREDTGKTYVLDHPYYSWLAGKPTYPKGMIVAETQKAGRPPPGELVRLIDEVFFDRVVVDLLPPFDFFCALAYYLVLALFFF